MRETADYINEMKRKADSRLRVVEVLDELKGVPNDFVRAGHPLKVFLKKYYYDG